MPKCSSPYCENQLEDKKSSDQYLFCEKCKGEHSYKVLVAQADHGTDIKTLLLDAAMFKSAGGMSDYIGVSFVTIYNWCRQYFNMSFQEFRRKYICKSTKCYLLDIERSSFSRTDYLIKKIRSKRYCACLNALETGMIMTNAPVSVVQSSLRGSPRIEKISDNKFSLVPDPVYFPVRKPVYMEAEMPQKFDDDVEEIETKEEPKRKSSQDKGERRIIVKSTEKKGKKEKNKYPFISRLMLELNKLGGKAKDDDLLENLLTDSGKKPRRNNTRREVYRNPTWLEFDSSDKHLIVLTSEGKKVVDKLLSDSKV